MQGDQILQFSVLVALVAILTRQVVTMIYIHRLVMLLAFFGLLVLSVVLMVLMVLIMVMVLILFLQQHQISRPRTRSDCSAKTPSAASADCPPSASA